MFILVNVCKNTEKKYRIMKNCNDFCSRITSAKENIILNEQVRTIGNKRVGNLPVSYTTSAVSRRVTWY